MADESCGPPKPVGTATSQPGARAVTCVKFGKKMEGLDRVPWKGELGQRIYENVSKEAWKLWIEHSKMIMNEYRLNPLDPQSVRDLGPNETCIPTGPRSGTGSVSFGPC